MPYRVSTSEDLVSRRDPRIDKQAEKQPEWIENDFDTLDEAKEFQKVHGGEIHEKMDGEWIRVVES